MKKKILVVDDNPINIRLVEAMIRNSYLVVSARGGEDAAEIFSCDPNIDLVLTDICMPKIDGYALADYLHMLNNRLGRNVPFLAMTVPETPRSPRQKGLFKKFIDVPFSKKTLLEAIDNEFMK